MGEQRGVSRQHPPTTSSGSGAFNRNLYIYDTQHKVRNRMHHFGGADEGILNPKIFDQLIRILDDHNELVCLFKCTRDKCWDNNVEEFKIRVYNAYGLRGYELPTSQEVRIFCCVIGVL
nr:helitron helicase-like domain-containing protein [Tanacetum cinerariifolium]